ncbi:hypothetical protein ACQP1G_15235 [Nocardia sp. CA-107356]|uniref:hypothetical protein n=1 Tax=Nocardia sp. CA-107356 TaxID=3239972 RepID=UPI003D92C479
MNKSGVTLSRSDVRRNAVADAAIAEFARTGYHGTPISTVAATARISPAYGAWAAILTAGTRHPNAH